MPKLFRPLFCGLLTMAVAGCGLVYRPVVQQGNLLQKKKVDQLKVGMTKRQVMVLLGSPSVASPFQHDRWDYVQSDVLRDGKTKVRKLTLYFDNNVLARTEGKFFTTSADQLLKDATRYKPIFKKGGPKGDKDYSGDSDKGGNG